MKPLRVTLTGACHNLSKDVSEVLCAGNLASIERVPERDAKGELAYSVSCKGEMIGWIPCLSSLRGYWATEKQRGNPEKVAKVEKWGLQTAAVRSYLEKDEKDGGQTSWRVKIYKFKAREKVVEVELLPEGVTP